MERESESTIERDGRRSVRSVYAVDFGKAGTAHVEVLDPCTEQEAQQRRRAALLQKCLELS